MRAPLVLALALALATGTATATPRVPLAPTPPDITCKSVHACMSAALAPLQKQLASLEKAVNAEIADRKAAIGGLGSTVTGLQAGLTTQAADIITLQNALAAETSTRQADDTALGRRLDTLGSTLDLTSLTTRVATLETAVNKETTGLIAQTATLRTDLTAETSERKNSVSGLLNDLASVSTEVDTLKGDVSALTTAVGLGQQQSGLIADFNTLKSDLAIETAACETLKTTVDSLASLPVEVDTLKATVGSKQNGDTAATGLCLQIDALRADLTAETSALQALQNTVEDLDPTDSSARLGALEAAVGTRDPVNAPALFAQTASLRADLTAETTARTQADTALDAKIAAEAIARRYAFFDEAQRHTWRPSTNTVRLLSSITGATIEVGALKDVVVMVAEYVAAPANYLLLDLSFTVESQIKFKCLNTYEYASWHYWYILTNGGIVMNIDFLAGGTRDHPFWDLADPTGNRFGDVPGGRMLVRVYLFNSKVEFRAIYCTRNTIVTIP